MTEGDIRLAPGASLAGYLETFTSTSAIKARSPDQPIRQDTYVAPPTYTPPATFTALTLNTGGLPGFLRFIAGSRAMPPKKSFPAIRDHIAPHLYDFVSIQEVFDDYGLLLDRDYDYRKGPSGARGNFLGDGLVQFSGLPMTSLARTKWEACMGIQDHDSDCLASKGYSVSIVTIGGFEAYVYTAHFDAGKTLEDKEARRKQLVQMLDDVSERTSKRDLPVFIIGDPNFNLVPPNQKKERAHEVNDNDLYAYIRKQYRFSDAFMAPEGPNSKSREGISFGLDRILYRSSKDVIIEAQNWRVPPELAALQTEADHLPVAATFRLSDAKAPVDTVLRRRDPPFVADKAIGQSAQ